MNRIEDKVLYSTKAESTENIVEQRYIHFLLDMVRKELNTTGDRVWLYDAQKQKSVMLSEIEPFCNKLAAAFIKLGFQPGDRLQMGSCNHINYHLSAFAGWLCGGVISLADPTITADNIRHQLNDTQAKIVVTQNKFLAQYLEIRKTCSEQFKIVVLDGISEEINDKDVFHLNNLIPDETPELDVDLGDFNVRDDALIFWSSGSTGAPKGIVHSHKNLKFPNFVKAENRVLMSNIMFHVGGFIIPIRQGINVSQSVGFMTDFNTADCLDILCNWAPNVVYLGIGHYIQLSACQKDDDRKFESLKTIVPCGGAITEGIHKKMISLLGEHVQIVEVYGSTELGIISSVPGDREKTLGLLGYLEAGASLYIQDMDGTAKLGPGEMGRIMIKSDTMMTKYLNNPAATQEFYGYGGGNGYGFAGDVGYYTENGDVFFSHRIKNTYKVENYWFGPGEIENLLEAVPEIAEAQVWAEYDPNTGNDIINVGITCTNYSNNLTAQMIRDIVANNLPETRKITGDVVFCTALPHSLQDKKLRRKMREWIKQDGGKYVIQDGDKDEIYDGEKMKGKGNIETLVERCLEVTNLQKAV